MTPPWYGLVSDVFRVLDVEPFSPLVLALLPAPLFFLRRQGKSAGYLVCFSLFFLYGWVVLTYTIFKFAPRSYDPEVVQNVRWSESIHLIPTVLSRELDPRSIQVSGNFLLGAPFGLGLPFVARVTHRRFVLAGAAFATGIELAQLLLGLLVFRIPYRVVDIDDVLIVFAGALSGYGVFLAAARLYRRIAWSGGARLAVWSHLHGVLLGAAASSPSGPPDTRSAGGR